MTRFRLAHHLKTSLWFVPLLFVLAGVALSLGVTALDDGDLIPQSLAGDPAAARQILYLIAFSMLTLTGLVLSLVVVVVQLAMGVFSPRIVRQILQDRPSQCAIGLFAGTFAFAILAIRKVRSTAPQSVPGLAVLVATVLALACNATLLWYVDHIGQSLRVAALVEWAAEDTLNTLERLCPDSEFGTDPEPEVIVASKGGVIFSIDHDRLVELARRADVVIDLVRAIGDFVPTGAPVARIEGAAGDTVRAGVLKSIAIGPERTLNQDLAYGIRMLVDVAEQSLATGPFDDPTTAVQAIDRLHDLLRQLALRSLPSGRYEDTTGTLRLIVPTIGWDGYVRIAFDEIRLAGVQSPQVSRRLKEALDDLLTIAPKDRRPPLEQQQALLEEAVAATTQRTHERRTALVADRSGLGSSGDLLTAARNQPRPTRIIDRADTGQIHGDHAR